ncbi:ankyrin repeat domain-containing protein [Novipirellula sp.]|uniref:ankyrin repeat domain-containing protein n=1 Tax=Novipirellula sp. TaxID=2795430 RepID=UPI003564A72B
MESGCLDEFNEAVNRGVTTTARGFNGRGVLKIAMRRGRHDMARRLIREGADPNGAVGKRGDRLIHLASRTGNIGFLTDFLDAGVDPNTMGNCRCTALHHVVKEKYEFMARILLDHHTNPDATDDQGNTPLHIAASKGYMPVIRLLLTHHATATISNNQLYTLDDLQTLPRWRFAS